MRAPALGREGSTKHDSRETHSHGAPVNDRVETEPIGRLGIANTKLSVAARNELLNAIEVELAFTQHDPRVAVPGTVVVVVTGESFPLFLRLKSLRAGILRAQVPIAAIERLRHLLIV